MSYAESFWRGLRDAVHRAKYHDGVNPEHSFEVCVPGAAGNDYSRGYRDGFLAGRALVYGARN